MRLTSNLCGVGLVLASATGLAACSTVNDLGATRLVDPSAACLAQIAQATQEETGQRTVVGPTAFADGAPLVLTPGMPRDVAGRPLDGARRMPPTFVFDLQRRGATCELVSPRSQVVRVLNTCRCEGVPR